MYLKLYLKIYFWGLAMKRFKNSSNPEPKHFVKWKLKKGITWDKVEAAGKITDEVLKKYF